MKHTIILFFTMIVSSTSFAQNYWVKIQDRDAVKRLCAILDDKDGHSVVQELQDGRTYMTKYDDAGNMLASNTLFSDSDNRVMKIISSPDGESRMVIYSSGILKCLNLDGTTRWGTNLGMVPTDIIADGEGFLGSYVVSGRYRKPNGIYKTAITRIRMNDGFPEWSRETSFLTPSVTDERDNDPFFLQTFLVPLEFGFGLGIRSETDSSFLLLCREDGSLIWSAKVGNKMQGLTYSKEYDKFLTVGDEPRITLVSRLDKKITNVNLRNPNVYLENTTVSPSGKFTVIGKSITTQGDYDCYIASVDDLGTLSSEWIIGDSKYNERGVQVIETSEGKLVIGLACSPENAENNQVFIAGESTATVEDSRWKSDVQVYPNPADNVVHIYVPSVINGTVHLYNVSGSYINSFPITSERSDIERGTLPSGMYLYQIDYNSAVLRGSLFFR